jgi:hypothetical protein
MKTLFSRRDLFAVFASVFMCVFMVGVISYGATITISSGGVGSGTSTMGAAIAAHGAGIFEGFVSADYFTSTSTNVSWIMGKLGIGTTTPSDNLNKDGGLAVAGGAIIGDSIYTSYLTATSTTATSTMRFGLDVATTSLSVYGNTGMVTIGATSSPQTGVANTQAVNPSLTVFGVGSTANATGTLYVGGKGSTGGQIIIRDSSGYGCISLMAKRGANDLDASALSIADLITAKVVACPK